jgi:hypothetical protein
MSTPTRKHQNDSGSAGALPAAEGRPAPAAAGSAARRRSAVEVRARAGGEIADLQEWVRRYVAIVIEADAARRAEDASSGAAPPSPPSESNHSSRS